MIDRLTALARQYHFAVDEELAAVRRGGGEAIRGRGGRGRGRGAAVNAEAGLESVPTDQPAFDLAYIQHHFAEAGVPRDATREAIALALARMQLDDGRWNQGPPRVPISGSPFVVTAAAARVLQVYGPLARASEMSAHIDRARRWLVANTPKDTQDAVFRTLGLHWTGAEQALVRRAADSLKREQNAD